MVVAEISCLPTHSVLFYSLTIWERSSLSSTFVPLLLRASLPSTSAFLGMLSSKNLFEDNPSKHARSKLIVRIELRCLLRVEFLTAHKT